uniref:Uncharacterized protein n=1 Tax=Romanomermis culicivorax TaxID=13658 RepID=A0A915KLH2_ROMCU
MWALDVSKLTLCFPAALRFLNNPSTSFLQSDVLAYAALDAYYPLLLFLAFGGYGFIPQVYNALALFPQDSLDTAEIDHLAETVIAAFHNVVLSDVLPPNYADRSVRPRSVFLFRNGNQWFLRRQSFDAYDAPETAHRSKSAKEEEEETKR